MQNGAATVKNGSESAKILSTEFPYDLAIALPGIYSRDENLCLHKSLYTNVYSNTIHKTKENTNSAYQLIDIKIKSGICIQRIIYQQK